MELLLSAAEPRELLLEAFGGVIDENEAGDDVPTFRVHGAAQFVGVAPELCSKQIFAKEPFVVEGQAGAMGTEGVLAAKCERQKKKLRTAKKSGEISPPQRSPTLARITVCFR
jgi:hypothetical protein